MARLRLAWLLAVTCGVTACSALVSLDDLRGPDAASDGAGAESGDAPIDAVNDAASDVLADAPKDAPIDAPNDAPSGTIAFVQQAADFYSTAGLSFASAVQSGDAVIVVVANSNPGAVKVTDVHSNSYVAIVGAYVTTYGGTLEVFAAFNVVGGFTTMNVTPPDGGTGYSYYAAEYKGITTFDGKAMGSTQSTATDALASGAVPTTASPELLFAYAEGVGTITHGTNFVQRSGFDTNVMEERIVNAPSSYQATATQSGSTADIILACFH